MPMHGAISVCFATLLYRAMLACCQTSENDALFTFDENMTELAKVRWHTLSASVNVRHYLSCMH